MFVVDRGGSMTVLGSSNCESSGLVCNATHASNSTTSGDGTLRTQDKEVISANGQDKVIYCDRDDNCTYDSVEDLDATVNADTTPPMY
jgi:hypothetical protein